jgi:hypothetical protein
MTTQLIYASRAATPAIDLGAILAVSRPRNEQAGITGYLLAGPRWFVQVLEGEETAVAETYARIGADPRHTDLTLIGRRPIRRRSFPHWSMGGRAVGAEATPVLAQHDLAEDFDPRVVPMPVLLALTMDLQDNEGRP